MTPEKQWGFFQIGGDTAASPERRFVPIGVDFICDKSGFGFKHEEDARLAMAAPDMKMALENLCRHVCVCQQAFLDKGISCFFCQGRKALDKATKKPETPSV